MSHRVKKGVITVFLYCQHYDSVYIPLCGNSFVHALFPYAYTLCFVFGHTVETSWSEELSIPQYGQNNVNTVFNITKTINSSL